MPEGRSWAWLCFLAAFLLATVLRFALPLERRRRLRGAFVLLGFFLTLSLVALPLPAAGAHALHLAAAFCLTLASLHVVFRSSRRAPC